MIPYPEQFEATFAAVTKERGIISAVTGSGKSLIIALIINELQCRTLIVVPSLELKAQLSTSLARWFGEDNIGRNKNIYVENVQALDTRERLKYDVLIIDEFHHSASASYRKLNKYAWADIYYRFGLTATPWRSDAEEKLLLESILSEVIYTISYKQAVSRNMIAPVEAYYLEIPKQETDAYTWSEVYSSLVVNNEVRNQVIAQVLKTLEQNNVFTLCLVKEVKHGQILANLTGVPFVHGEDEESRDYIDLFNRGEVKTLIATEGILGEGIDTKPCEYVIIAGLGKAKSGFLQKVGRAVRNYPGKESAKVILFKDKSHKYLIRHYNEQRKIMLEYYGVRVVELKA